MQSLCADSRVLVDGGHLDKADTDGVEKTANAMSQRWDVANKLLNERQNKWVEFRIHLFSILGRFSCQVGRSACKA